MKIKLEAAYHEAGHVVAAKCSKFHDVVGGIDLEAYGAGRSNISLSRSKLQSAGKIPNPGVEYEKEVVQDLAVVLTAGYVAEKIANQKNEALRPDRKCADPDYNLLDDFLQKSGLSRKTDRAENLAYELLSQEWDKVEKIAALSFEKGGLTFAQLSDLMDEILV